MALHLRIFASALIPGVVLALAVWGCGGSEPEYEEYGEPDDRPFPSEEVNRAKELIDKGSVLYTQAVNSMSQDERDSLANEAMDKYFRPAQAILERLAEEYPEHAGSIDGMQHDLMQKIDGVIKITGFGE